MRMARSRTLTTLTEERHAFREAWQADSIHMYSGRAPWGVPVARLHGGSLGYLLGQLWPPKWGPVEHSRTVNGVFLSRTMGCISVVSARGLVPTAFLFATPVVSVLVCSLIGLSQRQRWSNGHEYGVREFSLRDCPNGSLC